MPTEDDPLIRDIGRWLAGTQSPAAPESVDVLGRSFRVLPGVFSPGFYPETAFYAGALAPWFRPGATFLDLGCGVGVNSVLAADAGMRVVALDVNPAAVENTRLNARLHGVGELVDARVSDVFSALRPDERFDVVYWNVPFTYRDPGASLSPLEEAIFDPGYRKNRAYVERSRDHRTADGAVLMGISPTLGLADEVDALAAAAGLTVETVAEGLEEGTTQVLRLVRLTPVD